MPTDVVSLLISFMAVAVAGAAAYFSWKVPMALREEKFKEIIYARRFAVYDDLLAQIPRILFRHAAFSKMENKKDSALEGTELIKGIVQFKMTLEGASHLLPEKLQMLCVKFHEAISPDQGYISKVRPDEALVYWLQIIDFVRDDQAIEELSQSIKNTIGPPRQPDQ